MKNSVRVVTAVHIADKVGDSDGCSGGIQFDHNITEIGVQGVAPAFAAGEAEACCTANNGLSKRAIVRLKYFKVWFITTLF